MPKLNISASRTKLLTKKLLSSYFAQWICTFWIGIICVHLSVKHRNKSRHNYMFISMQETWYSLRLGGNTMCAYVDVRNQPKKNVWQHGILAKIQNCASLILTKVNEWLYITEICPIIVETFHPKKINKYQPHGVNRRNVRGSPKSVGLIISKSVKSVQEFMATNPRVVNITNWTNGVGPTNRRTDRLPCC